MIIPKDPNALVSPKPTFTRSKKYVKGEMSLSGVIMIGMNKGLMNNNGNLINIVRIMVDAGVSVGGAERIKLKDENENAANNIPGININKFIVFHNSKKIIPRMRGTRENKHPNMKELHTFPRRMATTFIYLPSTAQRGSH